MGLDVYVMPLCKFYSGDYTSPLEEAFGAKVQRIGGEKGGMTPEEAQAAVADLQRQLKEVLRIDTTWDDAGEPKGEQFNYDAFNALRAFAAHQDHAPRRGFIRKTPSAFDPSLDPASHPGLEKIRRGAATRFPHLIHHADNQGYWLPMDFEDPLALDHQGKLIAGSSVRLRKELEQLRSLLALTRPWGDPAEGESGTGESDPMSVIKYGCAFMLRYAELSCARRLPIVFDG